MSHSSILAVALKNLLTTVERKNNSKSSFFFSPTMRQFTTAAGIILWRKIKFEAWVGVTFHRLICLDVFFLPRL